jgi:hypothetical protein
MLGCRDGQYIAAVNIQSEDHGSNFTGSITYNGEGPITFKARQQCGNNYDCEVQWGGSSAPWHSEGTWIIGGRDVQRCIQLKADASGDGKTLNGAMRYEGEGEIGFKGNLTPTYSVENQWGGSSADWHPGGTWVLSGRWDQKVVSMDIKSEDSGRTLHGVMTYTGEGPIGFKGNKIIDNVYEVYNQWGGSSAPWHRGGDMVIGGRKNQNVVQLNFSSKGGQNLSGDMTYLGEGPIGFKAQLWKISAP